MTLADAIRTWDSTVSCLARERDDLRRQLAEANERVAKLRRDLLEVCTFDNVACIRAAIKTILADTAEGGGDDRR